MCYTKAILYHNKRNICNKEGDNSNTNIIRQSTHKKVYIHNGHD